MTGAAVHTITAVVEKGDLNKFNISYWFNNRPVKMPQLYLYVANSIDDVRGRIQRVKRIGMGKVEVRMLDITGEVVA